jgi:hypothetical protein
MSAPVMRPGGFLLLLALLRWRRPEARLLAGLACIPQTPVLYETVPLFLLVTTLKEGALLGILTCASGMLVYAMGSDITAYDEWMTLSGRWMVWLVYLPALAIVLPRPNVYPARDDDATSYSSAAVEVAWSGWRHAITSVKRTALCMRYAWRVRLMNRKLYVGNLPYQTTEQDLEQLFSQAGAVDTVRVMRDQATGRARGVAFVEMASEADAEKAVNQLHDQDYGGRKLTVNEARPQPARSGGGGGYGGGGRRESREPRW